VKLPEVVSRAAHAALAKQATEVVVLDLRTQSDFTDHFLLLSGGNQRQLVAITDAVLGVLRTLGYRPDHIEGYPRQEWILLDYGSFVVHVFTQKTRAFYDLERLWGGAHRMEIAG
jgi:ribosome-associated protein